MTLEPTSSSVPALSAEETKARNKMSVIIGLILAGVVVSFYAVTIVRLQGNVAKKLVLDQQAAASAQKSGSVLPAGKTDMSEKAEKGNAN